MEIGRKDDNRCYDREHRVSKGNDRPSHRKTIRLRQVAAVGHQNAHREPQRKEHLTEDGKAYARLSEGR